MSFREQSLGAFIDAHAAATAILVENGAKNKGISFNEAIAMQGAAYLLDRQPGFFGLELARLMDINRGTIYPILHRFENRYRILSSVLEDQREAALLERVPRRIYAATQLGQTVLSLFRTPEIIEEEDKSIDVETLAIGNMVKSLPEDRQQLTLEWIQHQAAQAERAE